MSSFGVKQSKTILVIVSIALLVFAGFRYSAAKERLRAHKWTLFEQSITLTPGEDISTSLAPDASADYQVKVKFVAMGDAEHSPQFLCDLGWVDGEDQKCPKKSPDLAVNWTVVDSSGKLVSDAMPTPQANSLGDRFGDVLLGRFSARSGSEYRLKATVVSSSIALRNYRPSLVVRLDPMRFKNAVASAQLNALVALLSVVLAVCLFSVFTYLWWHDRKKQVC